MPKLIKSLLPIIDKVLLSKWQLQGLKKKPKRLFNFSLHYICCNKRSHVNVWILEAIVWNFNNVEKQPKTLWWCVVTLALGSRLRQGFTKLQAKKEAWESHLVLLRMQKSVRAWTLTLPSEFPFWELDSQMDSQIFRGRL
jgi:hypothetical protein